MRKQPNESWDPRVIEALRSALSDRNMAIKSSFVGIPKVILEDLIYNEENTKGTMMLRAIMRYHLTGNMKEYMTRTLEITKTNIQDKENP
ncbi:hypothetical protein D3C72_2339770 [compost metagenome]